MVFRTMQHTSSGSTKANANMVLEDQHQYRSYEMPPEFHQRAPLKWELPKGAGQRQETNDPELTTHVEPRRIVRVN